MPDDYETAYRRSLPGPLQVRIGFDTDRGDVERFVVQLEYWHAGAWREVVRYDHDPAVHDVTVDGVHVDLYRDGAKVETRIVSPPMPAPRALDYAEEHLVTHLKEHVRRFERWHGIRKGP